MSSHPYTERLLHAAENYGETLISHRHSIDEFDGALIELVSAADEAITEPHGPTAWVEVAKRAIKYSARSRRHLGGIDRTRMFSEHNAEMQVDLYFNARSME